MEEEGIYYFFKHDANAHTLVLANSVIRNYIADSPGVRSIVSYDASLDTTERLFDVSCEIDTIFGRTALSEQLATSP